MMKKILILIILSVVLFNCKDDDDSNLTGLQIRLSNVSPYKFQNIVVNTTTGNVNFEDLKSGQKSAYKEFEKAYRYAFVELEIDGKKYTLQPIDYVGETLLEDGKYTYKIDASDSNDQYARLSLTLVED
jgi:uncharacterized lipoprotein YehR (DUF1307 family)